MAMPVAVAAAVQEPAQEPVEEAVEPAWSLVHRTWSRSTADVERLRIENRWGDIRLRGGEGDRVELAAAVQQIEGDGARFEVRNELRGGELLVWVEFEGGDAVASEGEEADRRRIDVAVALPVQLALNALATGGLVELTDLSSPVTVTTTSGPIVFVGTAPLEAISESGAVRAQFRGSASQDSGSTITTVRGSIDVELLADGAATFEVTTRGSITTDYSIEIERDPKGTAKRGVARVGEGGATIRIDSRRGDVRLRALVAPEAAREDG